jgi:galactokinase
LASSEYNQRREECCKGVEVLKKTYPDIRYLRDVTVDMLQSCKHQMNQVIFQRCKYVVEENDRVLQACGELEKGNLKAFGGLMRKTHLGLSCDYEVSCKELDFLVEQLKDNPYVYGSRMMGGGFGGCTINLIEKNHIEQIKQSVAEKYKKQFNIDLKAYITTLGSGTDVITV